MIPESQLEVWAKQGAVTTSAATRASIYNALTGPDSKVAEKDIEVFLQGSYGNDTNIRGNSDVDVVIQLNSIFYYDISRLSQPEQEAFRRATPAAPYRFKDFRADVLEVLMKYYGQGAITPGNKSIKVAAADGQRLPADVVPCCTHRTFLRYPKQNESDVIEGMVFFTTNEGREVRNYPKLHRENGTNKHGERATNGWFKPTVRMVKNARRALADEGVLDRDVAPSYFVEGLVYNMPNSLFGKTYQATLFNFLKWANEASGFEKLVCQNERLYLFGDTPEQWKQESAKRLVSALIDQWNDWNEG